MESSPAIKHSAIEFAYSVIIEWENVLLADSSRATEMLRCLSMQMAALESLGTHGEIILVRDAGNDVITGALTAVLASVFGSHAAAVRVIGVKAKRYYEKKNEGAAAARGEILVFLDSDVIPEPRWLEQLLAAFDDSVVDVVGGSTYISPDTLYSKAFAAFWFFPPRSSDEGLASADGLFGNNIAFRSSVFLSSQYPTVGQFRGQAGMLIRELRGRGAGIFLQRSSRCSHPPPNGLRHFIRRAMCDGHDNVVIGLRAVGAQRLPWRRTYWAARSWLKRAFCGIRQRRAVLQLSAPETAIAGVLALGYVTCITLGDVLTRLSPTLVPRRFSI